MNKIRTHQNVDPIGTYPISCRIASYISYRGSGNDPESLSSTFCQNPIPAHMSRRTAPGAATHIRCVWCEWIYIHCSIYPILLNNACSSTSTAQFEGCTLLKNNQEKCSASSLYLPLSSEVPPCACSIRHAKILVLIIIFSLRRQGVQRDHKWVLACILSVIENYLRNVKLGSWSVSCNFETYTRSSKT